MIISPSMLAMDFYNLEKDIKAIENDAQWLHIDVMDGLFVPNISFGFPIIDSIRKRTNLFFDAHLMIENPLTYVERFSKSGVDSICFHVESQSNVFETIKAIKFFGKKCGLALNPNTSVDRVLKYLPYVDMILVMTVQPGFGGQSFNSTAAYKIKQIKETASRYNPELLIQVDGGINEKTAKICAEFGADVIVAGNYIFSSENPAQTVKMLKEINNTSVYDVK